MLLLSLCFTQISLTKAPTDPFPDGVTTETVDATLTKLSDEQVRKLLINELKKDAALQNLEAISQELKGPSAPLASLLNSIEGIEYAMKQVDVPSLAERSADLNPAEMKQIVDAAGGAARILEEQQQQLPGVP